MNPLTHLFNNKENFQQNVQQLEQIPKMGQQERAFGNDISNIVNMKNNSTKLGFNKTVEEPKKVNIYFIL